MDSHEGKRTPKKKHSLVPVLAHKIFNLSLYSNTDDMSSRASMPMNHSSSSHSERSSSRSEQQKHQEEPKWAVGFTGGGIKCYYNENTNPFTRHWPRVLEQKARNATKKEEWGGRKSKQEQTEFVLSNTPLENPNPN